MMRFIILPKHIHQKQKCWICTLKNPEEYREYVNIMPDIFDLYDAVEMEFADAYNAGGGRYGRKKYAGYKDGKIVAKSKFGLNKMQYKVPDGLLYPVVAAFRSLLVKNKVTGKYEWKNGVGPIDVWDNNKEDLVNKIMNFAASIGDNPNAVGKRFKYLGSCIYDYNVKEYAII